MKRLLIAAIAAVSLIDCATAEPATLKVRISDLDLKSEKGIAQLESRLLRRMWAYCGHPNDAALTQINTGGGSVQRAECKAKLGVSPDSDPAVKQAFIAALAKF